jgi:PEP-CTERM motif-containing protein
MKWTTYVAVGAAVLALSIAASARAQLANPGFEADAVLNAGPVPGATGWGTFGNAATTSANTNPTHSGIGALRLIGGGNFSVPGAFQTFPASAGQIWDFQGYMLTPAALPANATFGLLKIVWSNGTSDLPPGTILIGQAAPVANPGIESLPFLNATSTPNTWQFTQARGIAPAGTTQVSFFALFVDQSAGTGYFDDLLAGQIPEPTTIAMFGLGTISCVLFGRRSRR